MCLAKKIRGLAILAIILAQTPVKAQGPMHFIEHDWTFQVGKARFGLYQDYWSMGLDSSRSCTTLYFGRAAPKTSTRSVQRAASVLSVSILALLVGAWLRKEASSAPNELKKHGRVV